MQNTDFARMGLHNSNPFLWQTPRTLTTAEQLKHDKRNAQKRDYKRRMREAAMRVNPEVAYSTQPTKSERAPR